MYSYAIVAASVPLAYGDYVILLLQLPLYRVYKKTQSNFDAF